MKQELAEKLVEASQELPEELTLLPTYSGRSMYGEKTPAVSGKRILGAVATVAAELGAAIADTDSARDQELLDDLTEGFRWDQLGTGYVWY